MHAGLHEAPSTDHAARIEPPVMHETHMILRIGKRSFETVPVCGNSGTKSDSPLPECLHPELLTIRAWARQRDTPKVPPQRFLGTEPRQLSHASHRQRGRHLKEFSRARPAFTHQPSVGPHPPSPLDPPLPPTRPHPHPLRSPPHA